MSVHHRRTRHTTHAPDLRAKLERMLPLPCQEGCGKPVLPGQSWHLAHIVPASQGGRTTAANTGVAHAGCNLRSGGRLGAEITNRRRKATRQAEKGRRQW